MAGTKKKPPSGDLPVAVPLEPDELEEATPLPSDALELIEDDLVEEAKPAVSRPEAPAHEPAFVVVADVEGHETVFALDRPVLSFGREESNQICIPDKKCSRKHFMIEMAGDYYNAIDLGSTNGLIVNGKKVEKRRLRQGDAIILGDFTITYHGPSEEGRSGESSRMLLSPAGDTEKVEYLPATVLEPAKPEPPVPKGPEPLDDAKECPQCKAPMPEHAPCPTCGHKSLELRAQEQFVDTIAKNVSLLGGLGLWKIKRAKALAQAFTWKEVDWVLKVTCAKCGTQHRALNEFRVRCERCAGCGVELALPVHEPPKLE